MIIGLLDLRQSYILDPSCMGISKPLVNNDFVPLINSGLVNSLAISDSPNYLREWNLRHQN
jgi:hypothetical protein